MMTEQNPQLNVSCCYILSNSQTSEIKIGATHCLSRRLFEHQKFLPGFQLDFYVVSNNLNPFIIEKFLHHYVKINDLVIDIHKNEIFKCNIQETIEKLRNHIIQISKLTWYTVTYEKWPNKHPIHIIKPYSKKATKINQHIWEGILQICEKPQIQIPTDLYYRDYYELEKERFKQRAKAYYSQNREAVIQKVKEYQRRKKNSVQATAA